MKRLSIYLLTLLFVQQSFAQKKLSLPEQNFEFFWNTFNKNYAHFDLKKVKWNEQYTNYRPLVTKKTKPDALFNILNKMVEPLQDRSISISRTADTLSTQPHYLPNELTAQLQSVTNNNLAALGFGELTYFGKKSDEIGGYAVSENYCYLQLQKFGGTALGEYELQLDQMMVQFLYKDAVFIDIRDNSGGEIAFANAVKKRFSMSRFTKPVVLLTNSGSMKEAEIFALNLMELRNVVLIGEATAGILSDKFTTSLPNGWQLTFSNLKQPVKNGKNYDGVGIPVNISVSNAQADFSKGKDPILNKAVEYIDKQLQDL